MIYLTLLLLQVVLPEYSVTVEPELLTELYENFQEEMEIPATIQFDSLSLDCTLAFRGGTSLWCQKKSWHIRIQGESPFHFGNHLLLNAQYRDPSLIRNTLGLAMTRLLGFPAPETEFVVLQINGNNFGVYERVQRIDRLFYQEYGLGFGPLFKNVDTMGRFVCQYSDTTSQAGFEPRIDSDPYGNQLVELMEHCFNGDVSGLQRSELLAMCAVNTAIGDTDGLVKNFYLHKYQDTWHIYPWDRDATFGNTWEGEYDPAWTTQDFLYDIGYSGASLGLLASLDNVLEFNSMVLQCSDLLSSEYPAMVDSFRLLLRDELQNDPYYQYSAEQFDSLCAVLAQDMQLRSDHLQGIQLTHRSPVIESVTISNCLDMDNELEVELQLQDEDALGVSMQVSFDGQQEQWIYMSNDDRDAEWEAEIPVPEGTYSANIVFGPWFSPPILRIHYPSWGMRDFHDRPSPSPAARVALAPLSTANLTPGEPVWVGNQLWVLPIENTAGHVQDLSFCYFAMGEPSGSIFFHDSVLVQPGETFYLTNNAGEASRYYSGDVFGDAGTQFPGGSQLILHDPSWNQLHTWSISQGDSLQPPQERVIASELSLGEGPDWIELFNAGSRTADLSGWFLMDSRSNISVFPENTYLPSGQFIVLWEELPAEGVNPLRDFNLDFSLCRIADSLRLVTNLGCTRFSFGWNELWPGCETGLMYLNSPTSPLNSPYSWTSEMSPGSPGEPNPGWSDVSSYTSVQLTSMNPCNGAFSFSWATSSLPVEAILFDMSGRVIASLDLPFEVSGSVSADFSSQLPSGVYILYLRSSTGTDSFRLTVLAEE